MSVTAVHIGPPPGTVPAEVEEFDPGTFVAEVIADIDAAAGSTKCNCAASDDNPY